jgi:hypothetical protein
MKLRIQGNSIRLRVSRSDLAKFVESGILEETIFFGRNAGSELTYALVRDPVGRGIDVVATAHRFAVQVPAERAVNWAETDEVGVSGEVDLGARGILSVLIEKDFACLDQSAEENEDTFPNPLAATHVC